MYLIFFTIFYIYIIVWEIEKNPGGLYRMELVNETFGLDIYWHFHYVSYSLHIGHAF